MRLAPHCWRIVADRFYDRPRHGIGTRQGGLGQRGAKMKLGEFRKRLQAASGTSAFSRAAPAARRESEGYTVGARHDLARQWTLSAALVVATTILAAYAL